MDYKIVWTDAAIADLRQICEYISEEDPIVAKQFTLALIGHAEQLESFPKRGKVDPRIGAGRIRELAYRGYRIFYTVYEDKKRVDILLVWHGARSEPDLN